MTVTLGGSDLPQRNKTQSVPPQTAHRGTSAGIELRHAAAVGPSIAHQGESVITGYHQPPRSKWTLTLIILTVKKKTQLSGTKHCSSQCHSLCDPTYAFVHAPFWRICYWSAICVYVFVYFRAPGARVCVCVHAGDGQLLFLHAGAAAIGFVQGSRIGGCVGDPSTLTGPL